MCVTVWPRADICTSDDLTLGGASVAEQQEELTAEAGAGWGGNVTPVSSISKLLSENMSEAEGGKEI